MQRTGDNGAKDTTGKCHKEKESISYVIKFVKKGKWNTRSGGMEDDLLLR